MFKFEQFENKIFQITYSTVLNNMESINTTYMNKHSFERIHK